MTPRLVFNVQCPYCGKVDIVGLEFDVQVSTLATAPGWAAAELSLPVPGAVRAGGLLVCEACFKHHNMTAAVKS